MRKEVNSFFGPAFQPYLQAADKAYTNTKMWGSKLVTSQGADASDVACDCDTVTWHAIYILWVIGTGCQYEPKHTIRCFSSKSTSHTTSNLAGYSERGSLEWKILGSLQWRIGKSTCHCKECRGTNVCSHCWSKIWILQSLDPRRLIDSWTKLTSQEPKRKWIGRSYIK